MAIMDAPATREDGCWNCFFARWHTGDDGNADLTKKVCKHDPPRVMPMPHPNGAGIVLGAPRPIMHPNDWCGEHVTREVQALRNRLERELFESNREEFGGGNKAAAKLQ